MASKLTLAWWAAVLMLCFAVSRVLLPAGVVVRRAENIVYRIMDEPAWLPEDARAQAARNRANDLVAAVSLWEERDSVRKALGAAIE